MYEGKFPDSPRDKLIKKQIHARCIQNFMECIRLDPFVHLMITAIKAKGCPVDVERHFVCEACNDPEASSIFDYSTLQVAVCEENCVSNESVCSALRKELIHVFDFCRAEFNPSNLEHLACTEIRAANIVKCPSKSLFNWKNLLSFTKESNENCVRKTAVDSLQDIAPNMDRVHLETIVSRVFTRCYNDLEPIGRRPQKDCFDKVSRLAARDLRFYGYKLDETQADGANG